MTILTFEYGDRSFSLKNKSDLARTLSRHVPERYREEFEALLEDAGDGLRRFLEEKKAELLRELPEQYHFLLERLGDFDEATLDLFEFSASQDATGGMLQLASDARLLLDRQDGAEPGEDSRLAPGEHEALLRLQLSGGLRAGAEVKGQAGVLTAGLGLAGTAAMRFGYGIMGLRRNTLLEELARAKGLLHWPARLRDTVAAMTGSSLCRVERAGDVGVTFGMTVGIGHLLEGLVEGLPAQGGARMSLAVEYRDKAEFALIVEKLADGVHLLDFRKVRRKTRGTVLKLGADLRITGFRERLIERITQAIPEDRSVRRLLAQLDELGGRLTRDVLATRLRGELEAHWPQGKPVFDFLLGGEEAAALAENIRAELQAKVEEAVETRIDPWSENAERAGRQVAAAVAAELQLPVDQRARLDAYVGGAVGKAIEEFQDRLDSALDEWTGKAGDGLADLLRPWEFIGGGVRDAVDALANGSTGALDKARSALRDIQGRYARFRLGVLNTVKEKMEEEVSLAIIGEKDRTRTHSHSLRLEFTTVTPAIEALYSALWAGDLRRFDELAGALRGDPAVRALSGEYVNVLDRVSKYSVHLNLLGLRLAGEQLFSERIEIGVDQEGRLVSANGRAELRKRRRSLFGQEAVQLGLCWHLDYLRRDVLDAPLVIKLCLSDDKFEAGGEVEEFFGALEGIGALREGVASQVETTLFGSGGRAVSKAEITLNVALCWQDWLRIVGADPRGEPVPDAWEADGICRVYLDQLRRLAPRQLRDAEEMMAGSTARDLLDYLKWLGAIPNDERAARLAGGTRPGSRLPRTEFTVARTLGVQVHRLNSGLHDLQLAWRTLVADLDPAARHGQEERRRLQERMEEVNRHFARAFERIFSTGYVLDDVGRISPCTCAGLRLFLLGSELRNPYLSCTFASERTGTLLFS